MFALLFFLQTLTTLFPCDYLDKNTEGFHLPTRNTGLQTYLDLYTPLLCPRYLVSAREENLWSFKDLKVPGLPFSKIHCVLLVDFGLPPCKCITPAKRPNAMAKNIYYIVVFLKSYAGTSFTFCVHCNSSVPHRGKNTKSSFHAELASNALFGLL